MDAVPWIETIPDWLADGARPYWSTLCINGGTKTCRLPAASRSSRWLQTWSDTTFCKVETLRSSCRHKQINRLLSWGTSTPAASLGWPLDARGPHRPPSLMFGPLLAPGSSRFSWSTPWSLLVWARLRVLLPSIHWTGDPAGSLSPVTTPPFFHACHRPARTRCFPTGRS